MEKTEDRRVRKTKRAMEEALAKLLAEKPLNNISVREISELADINRGTFYLHYKDVYDMVEKLQDEIFEKFQTIVDNHDPKKSKGELFPMLIELFNLLAENAPLAGVLMSKNGDAAFVEKLKHVIREKCFTNALEIFKIKNSDEFTYFYYFIVSGCIGIFTSWLDNGMKETPYEIASFTEKLIVKSVKALG